MEEKNLPPLRTPEQRKKAMAKAIHTRRERAAFKAACKAGNIPPEAAIEGPRLVDAIKGCMTAKEDGQ